MRLLIYQNGNFKQNDDKEKDGIFKVCRVFDRLYQSLQH